MLNLIFAPDANRLAALAEDKIKEAWRDPFNPPKIIVPNPAVGKWLTLELCKSSAFESLINAQPVTLEKFLWNALKANDNVEMLKAEHLSQVICAILSEDVIKDKIYTPVKNYLTAQNGNIDALKRVQLSMKIAAQFLEYEYNRPSVWDDSANAWKSNGIDASWLLGKNYYDGNVHEAWQMDLYRRANRCFAEKKLMTLPQLYRRRREICASEKRKWCNVGNNGEIILFGVSKISHFHRNTLVEISQAADVDMHVLLTNPCAEFWEDVDTSRKSFRRKWHHNSPKEEAGIMPVKPSDYDKSELDMFTNEDDHALLKLWGGAGKENIFLWCPQAHWNFEYHGGDDDALAKHESNTLLNSIQKSLLLRKNELEKNSVCFKDDNSLQILACPDISREVEEIRELILDMAHEKLIAGFNDIAVYIPDTNKYLPHIERVFGAYPQSHSEYIPFTVLNASCKSSLMSKALFALIDIISGQFNRARIFALLQNPIVWESKKISQSDVAQWEKWANDFGMFRGYDAASRKHMGDKGEAITDEHTFKRGMEKVFAEISSLQNIDTQEGGGESFFDTLLPSDNEPSNAQLCAETFSQILSELNTLMLSFISTNGDDTLDICEAVKNLQEAIWSWLKSIPNDDSVNYAIESYVRRETLTALEKILLQHNLAKRERMQKDEFIHFARGCVCVETAIPSSAWNGVTFAPLRSSMVLPHRVIFALGLDAGDFPGVNESGSWDLLTMKRSVGKQVKSNRIVGDSDKVRDNRFAFLELIHAAKERLILSYRAHNMQKDEPLQPSSVILELEEYLIRQGLTKETDTARTSSIRRKIPWVVHESLSDAVLHGRKHGSWSSVQLELFDLSAKRRVKHRHELLAQTESSPLQRAYFENSIIDIYDLKSFLKNPLEYHLYRTLGIRDKDNVNDMSSADEPMSSDFKLYYLRQNIWLEILRLTLSANATDGEVSKIADDIYSEHVDMGQAPEGYVMRAEREILRKWATDTLKVAQEIREHFGDHELALNYELSYECEPFVINGTYKQIILPKIEKNLNVGVIAFDKKCDKKSFDAHCALWLDGAIQLLHGVKTGIARNVSLVLLGHGDKPAAQIQELTINPNRLSDMENWLHNILSQIIIEKHCEHLPFEAIYEVRKKEELTSGALREYLLKNPYKSFNTVFKLADARSPIMTNEKLQSLVNSRYAPIFEGWLKNE